MPIRRYLEHGVVFSPEALSAMGKAFEAAIWTLGPECDEMKREAVAKFIIRLAREDGNLGATTLHRRTVAAFGSPTVACSSMNLDTAGRPRHEPQTIETRMSVRVRRPAP
jgi:hypothetical protein